MIYSRITRITRDANDLHAWENEYGRVKNIYQWDRGCYRQGLTENPGEMNFRAYKCRNITLPFCVSTSLLAAY